jgi:hypothetical protein
MRRRPRVQPFSPDQVRITREGEHAILDAADPSAASVSFRLGEQIHSMSDAEILDAWNRHAEATQRLADEYEHVAIEIPPGKPQIAFFEEGHAWTPRGDVLRCLIDHDRESEMPLVHIDEHTLTWEEFGRLLLTWEGWGMRITAVPEDELHREPEIEVRDRDESPGGGRR